MTLLKDKPLEEKKALIKAMILRMAAAYGIKKSAIPKQLGISKALVNNWVYYGRVPYDYLERCRADTGVTMDWLLFGDEKTTPLLPEDMQSLKTAHSKVIIDGIDFGMIEEKLDGAASILNAKLDKNVDEWSQNYAQRHKAANGED